MSDVQTPAKLTQEEKMAKLNAELNGHRDQTPNLPPGETVESLIAKEDRKIDLTKVKLFKDVESDAPDPKKPGAQLVDPDAPIDGKLPNGTPTTDTTTAPAPPRKTLKQRAEDHEALAKRQADKFRKDTKAREEATAAKARADAAEAKATELAAQNSRTLKLLEDATKSPEAALAFVAKHGVTAVTLAKAAVDTGKTPAQVAKTAIEEKIDAVLEENKQLKAENAARDKAAEDARKVAEQRAKYDADEKAFIDNFTAHSATKYPTLARLVGDRPNDIVARFIGFVHTLQARPETAAELKAHPDLYNDDVLLALYEKVTAKDLAALNKAPADDKTGQTTSAPPDKKTGATAAPKTKGKRSALPANFDSLPNGEQNRLLAEWTSKHAIKTE